MTVYYLCEPCSLTHDNNMSFPVRTLNDGHRSGSTMGIVKVERCTSFDMHTEKCKQLITGTSNDSYFRIQSG